MFSVAKRLFAFTAVLVVGAGGGMLGTTPSGASGGTVEHVATTGTDSGNCISAPCKTIGYAISVAPAGQQIHVAAGTYNETVDINKPIKLVGAGASTTTINGAGLDPSGSGYYGVVYVGNAGGVVTVQGFTITNPMEYAYTGGEPMAVALADQNAGDQVNITSDDISMGTADSNAADDFPIGIDSFLNAATTTISGDSITGFFQGALLEDNGPVSVSGNQFFNLITGTDTSTSPPTVYPAEGLFFLADEGAIYSGQDASSNEFYSYSGYGIAEDAGYQFGYVGLYPGCIANGSIGTALTSNQFALTGGQTATGIGLEVTGPGNSLTGTVNLSKGYVTAPSIGIEVQSISPPPTPSGTDCGPYSSTPGGGGALDVTQNKDKIVVRSAHASARGAATRTVSLLLHFPHHPGSPT
jgi:Protein of unknown function (DUF1565)